MGIFSTANYEYSADSEESLKPGHIGYQTFIGIKEMFGDCTIYILNHPI